MNFRRQLINTTKVAGILALFFVLNGTNGFCEIIPADRQVQWQGNVGVAGGIPVRTTVCTTLSPSGGDDSNAIQNALNGCPENQVVKLNPGTFRVSRSIDWQRVRNGVVLRGSGPEKTTITFSAGNMLMRGSVSEAPLSTEVNLSADGVKGQNYIYVSSVPSWVRPGHYYIIDQLDDPSFVMGGGTEGGRSYREIKGNGARGLGQIVKVKSKTSNQIFFETPLYYGYRVAFNAQLAQAAYNPESGAPKYQCGIEDLKLTATYSGKDQHMIVMQVCDNCWVKNVHTENAAGGSHVMVQFSYRCEIRDSLFSKTRLNTGGQGYGVALYHVSSGCLVENNIFDQLHASMMVCYGSSGNVFGYNYERNGVADSGQYAAMSTHGVHAYMNLWEGNYVEDKVLGDWTHGSSSHNTVFRNRVVGYHSGSTLDQTPVSIEKNNRKWNVIGNILGLDGWHSIYSICPPGGGCAQTSCSDTSRAIFKFGFNCNWACDNSSYDTFAVNAAIVHGNYDTVSKQIRWDGNISDRTLRPSYYLSGKPSWFGSLAWPPYDPANPGNADATRIPAGYRYKNGATPGSAPAPPKNLRIVS